MTPQGRDGVRRERLAICSIGEFTATGMSPLPGDLVTPGNDIA